MKCLHLLGAAFPPAVNDKGFRVLPDCIRLIQGDGIDGHMINSILEHMLKFKWSADNVAFGSGGALLQKHNRDTQKCAFKCSAAVVDGAVRCVFKDPISDAGKKSKKGFLFLVHDAEGWRTVQQPSPDFEGKDELQAVFENGELLIDQTLDEIRDRAQVTVDAKPLPKHTCAVDSPYDKDCAACNLPCSNPTAHGGPCALCDHAQWKAFVDTAAKKK